MAKLVACLGLQGKTTPFWAAGFSGFVWIGCIYLLQQDGIDLGLFEQLGEFHEPFALASAQFLIPKQKQP